MTRPIRSTWTFGWVTRRFDRIVETMLDPDTTGP